MQDTIISERGLVTTTIDLDVDKGLYGDVMECTTDLSAVAIR